MFYQGGPIDHCKHVLGPVVQSSTESGYNSACPAGMALSHFRMLNIELFNKDPYVVPKQAPLIILDSKSYMCMSSNGNYNKHTINISRRMHFVRNIK